MNEKQKWVVAIFDPSGSEITKTAPMSLDEASVAVVQLGKSRVTASMRPLLDAVPAPATDETIVQKVENMLGWVVIAGAPGERCPIAFFGTLPDAENYLEDTELGLDAFLEGTPERQHYAFVKPEIVPACAVQLCVGAGVGGEAAHAVVEATGTSEHPGAKRFLQDAWARENGRPQ